MATPIPKNQATFTLAELALATQGRVILPAQTTAPRSVASWASETFRGVTSDSRNVLPGEIFVALIGARFDGHEHVERAIASGARCAIVSRPLALSSSVPAAALIQVEDTLAALGAMARAHLSKWRSQGATGKRRVVAITGSAGKTTTRHATTSLLTQLGFSVHASTGNLNNEIGVPFTLFGLEPRHDIAVVEVGMNTKGEIGRLAAVVEPDAAVVTLVAEAHTEGVGSLFGVLQEKSALLAALPREGHAIVNGDDAAACAALVRASARNHVVYGQSADAAVRLLERRASGLDGSDLIISIRLPNALQLGGDETLVRARIPLLGLAGTYGALAALGVLRSVAPELCVDGARLAGALAAIGGNEGGRLNPEHAADGTVVIDDAYNANPASMRASIVAAREAADALGRQLFLVLGAMFELGERSAALHREVGEAAAAVKPIGVVVTGAPATELAAGAREGGATVHVAADAVEAQALALRCVPAGAVVLVKASNSI